MIAPWLEDAWRALDARVREKRVPHALLIAGSAGLGKRAFADALAARLLCTSPTPEGFACGACRGCTLRAAGSHPDSLVVTFGLRDDGKPRTEIVVEQIRDLSSRLSMTPQFGGLQVIRIDPAEYMNVAAANALLKTLEEPAADTVIVLVADEPARLPATIRSRCQRVDARFPARAQALGWLAAQGVAAADAESALDLASGNPGLALELADPAQRALLADTVGALAGLLERKVSLAELGSRWAKDDAVARLALIAQALRLLGWRALGLPAARPGALDPLGRLTARLDFSKLWTAWDSANRARREIGGPLRAELVLVEVLKNCSELAA